WYSTPNDVHEQQSWLSPADRDRRGGGGGWTCRCRRVRRRPASRRVRRPDRALRKPEPELRRCGRSWPSRAPRERACAAKNTAPGVCYPSGRSRKKPVEERAWNVATILALAPPTAALAARSRFAGTAW